VFRHYPEAARIEGADDCLRPFQVALYELVPAGEKPSGTRTFAGVPPVKAFAEPTTPVALAVKNTSADLGKDEKTVATAGVYDAIKESTAAWRGFAVTGAIPSPTQGGTLVVCALASRDGKSATTPSIGGFFKASGTANGTPVEVAPVLADKTYPATWQAWRIPVPAAAKDGRFAVAIACRLPAEVTLDFQGHFIPAEKHL